MANTKWSVALRAVPRDDPDNDLLSHPGDIVAFKDDKEDWSDLEKQRYQIITLQGLTLEQMRELLASEYDDDGIMVQWRKSYIEMSALNQQGIPTADVHNPDKKTKKVKIKLEKIKKKEKKVK